LIGFVEALTYRDARSVTVVAVVSCPAQTTQVITKME
jgi:hypothetical protein